MRIVFEDVSFSYGPDSDKVAVDSLHLSIEQGSFWGVAGRAGSGKSTFAQLAAMLLVPTKGRVLIGGKDTSSKKNRRELLGEVGIVFQHPDQQLFAPTVYEEVAFAPRNMGLASAEIESRVRDALHQVGIADDPLLQRNPYELSGGYRRRVGIASVLAMRPHAVIFDEPTAGLDAFGRKSVRDLLVQLHKDGTTVILLTHSMEIASALCGSVLLLDRGGARYQGKSRDLFSLDNIELLRECGLDVPRAVRFGLELRQGGLPLAQPADSIDRLADALAAILRKEKDN